MTEMPRDREPSPTGTNRLARTVRAVGGGVGCLLFVALAVVAVVGALGAFLDEPLLWIAFVAVIVAIAARRVGRR